MIYDLGTYVKANIDFIWNYSFFLQNIIPEISEFQTFIIIDDYFF